MSLLGRPLWLWLIVLSPFLIWLALWLIAQNPKVSLRLLKKWLFAAQLLIAIPFFALAAGWRLLALWTWADR
jgi:hypothetical protein